MNSLEIFVVITGIFLIIGSLAFLDGINCILFAIAGALLIIRGTRNEKCH